jgi:hypothetical protein
MAVEFITLEEGVNLLKNPREGHASFPYRRDKSLKRSSTGPSTKKSKSSTSAESSSGENTALNDFRKTIGLSRDGFKMKLLNEMQYLSISQDLTLLQMTRRNIILILQISRRKYLQVNMKVVLRN